MNVVIEFAKETQEREKLLKEVKEIMIRECQIGRASCRERV